MANKKRAKSTQTYTFNELYNGAASVSGYDFAMIRSQDENKIQVVILQGQQSSTFLINRLIKGVSKKNGLPWSKWEPWGQVNISTKERGNAGNKLNLYGMHRTRYGDSKKWVPFRNITPDESFLTKMIHPNYINDFNREVERLVTANIGVQNVHIEDYLIKTKDISPIVKDGQPLGNPKSHPHAYAKVEYSLKEVVNNNILPAQLNIEPYRYCLDIAYPLSKSLYQESIPQGMSKYLRETDPVVFVKKLFGAKNYRKDLMKACFSTSLNVVYNASVFKNLVPTDWIIDYLKNSDRDTEKLNIQNAKEVKKIFKSLTFPQRKRLLDEMKGEKGRTGQKFSLWQFDDTIRMWIALELQFGTNWVPGQLHVKSWKELHDFLDKDLKTRRTRNQIIEKVPLAQKIENINFSPDFTLVTPDSTHTLIEWGKAMGHCIGSYTREARSGADVFIGIMENDVMIGNAHINVTKKSLVQIFGKRNTYLNETVLTKFSDVLIKEKVLTKNSFKDAYGFKI